MSHPPPPKPPAPLDALEFEVTDFEDARRSLDELPAGVQQMQKATPDFWARRRRGPMPSDRALTGAAMDWVVALPPSLRPHATCAQFPRVVNTIAESWSDGPRCARVLDQMLNDHRGGRRGFPATVAAEIGMLMRHLQQTTR